MATKRAKRIDPNEAFASIVGTQQAEEPAQAAAIPVARPGAPVPPAPAQTMPQAAPAQSVPQQPTQGVAPQAAGAGEAPEWEAPRKLVQKGYYLTEEQARSLGVYAAMLGVDRSSVVRAALDEYFAAHPVG